MGPSSARWVRPMGPACTLPLRARALPLWLLLLACGPVAGVLLSPAEEATDQAAVVACEKPARHTWRYIRGAAKTHADKRTVAVVVNVHEKPEVCLRQLDNFNRHLGKELLLRVALNCNCAMYGNLSKVRLPGNVHLNPEVVEKDRFTGSLLQGIVSNLRFLASRYRFPYALVLSSRNKVLADVEPSDFERSLSTCQQFIESSCQGVSVCHMMKCESRKVHDRRLWRSFNATGLAAFVRGKAPDMPLFGGPHEGLVLEGSTVLRVLDFLDAHPTIEEELYSLPLAAEEFALHTLAMFVGGRFGYLGGSGMPGSNSFYKITKVQRFEDEFAESA